MHVPSLTLVQKINHSFYKNNVYELSTTYNFFIECKPIKCHWFSHLQQLQKIPKWNFSPKILGIDKNLFKYSYSIFINIYCLNQKKDSSLQNNTFAQIYQVQRYGQFKMHGSVINVPLNLNRIQLVLPCLPKEITLGLIIKIKIEYKYLYASSNIWPIQANSSYVCIKRSFENSFI